MYTGFSDDIGCWKIIEMRSPRMARISAMLFFSRSSSWKRISPETTLPGAAMRRRMENKVTLLPQPDSPTNPRISPRSIFRSTPSTAFTTPSRVKK